VQTAEGELRIEIPQVREAAMPFVSKLFPKWHCKRLLRTDPLKALIVGGFVRGLSMRDVESLCEEAGLGRTSRSTVCRVCAELHERFEAFKRRSLYDLHLVVLFLDAIHLPVRPSGPKEGVICAWGITETGERALVSVRLGMREAKGDIRRSRTSRQLVAYLGLGPKVRQSGSEPARLGRISKQGSPQTRWALVDATHSVILQPGLLRAFHQQIRARRGLPGRNRRGRTETRVPVLVPAHTRRELRARPTVPHRQEAPQARADRRRQPRPPVGQRDLLRQLVDARSRETARPASRGLLRADGPRLASHRTEESGRERDTGARIN
jgi:Transposase, Mutator family/Transposase IS116/IS110/IS902 family